MHSNTNAAVLRHRIHPHVDVLPRLKQFVSWVCFNSGGPHQFRNTRANPLLLAATSNAFVWRVTCHKWVESNRGVNNVQTMAIKLFNRVWKSGSKCRGPRLIPPPPLVSGPPHSGPSHLLQNLHSSGVHRPPRSFPTAARHTNNWDWPAVCCP